MLGVWFVITVAKSWWMVLYGMYCNARQYVPDINDTCGLHLSLPANRHLGELPFALPSISLFSSIHV